MEVPGLGLTSTLKAVTERRTAVFGRFDGFSWRELEFKVGT